MSVTVQQGQISHCSATATAALLHPTCIIAEGVSMQRSIILTFGVTAYTVFFLTFLYLIAFVGNLQLTSLVSMFAPLATLVPRSIDTGGATGSMALALIIDFTLIMLFGVQHSVMARSGFKNWLKRHLPAPAERSIYVLISSLMLILLFWQWRPVADAVWQITGSLTQVLCWSLFAAGFGIVLLSTFLIDHFDLFGLRQVWAHARGREARPPQFAMPLFYRMVRHPLYIGFLLAFWSTPKMSAGHLLFAVVMTVYILIAIRLEERDLVRYHGELYQRYRDKVPMLIPLKGWSQRLD